jgi:imidazolonepropionase-like amidohydrolase
MVRCVLAGLAMAAVSTVVQVQAPPTFRLFFLGHEIGVEHDTVTTNGDARELRAAFHFVDRGTAIDLAGTLIAAPDGAPRSLAVKGRNYRLFASDSEVTIASGRAHVRDLEQVRDVEIGGRPFFPIDNYAPIGVQEALVQYWLSHGRPVEMTAAPSGPIRIRSRGRETEPDLERLAIDGVVWGTETAWVQGDRLVALTTWAGALPFEAVRDGFERDKDRFIATAAADRVADLEQLTRDTPVARSGAFALVGARLIDGTDRPSIENAAIVIRDGRIVAVGPRASVHVPADVAAVDVAGKTIVPGLWDAHAHAAQVDWAPVYLASGVTTIRDMGGEEAFLIAVRDAIASGKALGPRYLLAGLIDGAGPRAFGMVSATTAEEAVKIVRRYHDEGFQEIKIYIETPAALVPVIADEAHRLGMTVTGHLPSGLTWQTAVEAGYDGIAHMQLRGDAGSDQSKQQIAFFKAHNTVMDPTQSWNELSARPKSEPLSHLLAGVERLPLPLKRMFDSMAGGNGNAQDNSLKLLENAVDAGVLVIAGTDKGVPGFSIQRELELYVKGGMTPLEAIQAATIVPARAMKLDREVGSIEAGKRADMVVLDENPLDAIANIRTATRVVANGKLYDCDALWKAAGFRPR